MAEARAERQSRPVAQLLWQAYATGAKMRERLTGEGFFKTAIIDDHIAPQVGKHETVEEFTGAYEEYLTALQNKLAQVEAYRVPVLQKLETKNRAGWNLALRNAVKKLHDNQAWVDPDTGKRLSIGLVRMANIRPAIETARHLAEKFPQAMVACYHSNHFTIQRWHMEKRLDELLTRKNGDAHILKDMEIREVLNTSKFSELMLIVVATPVEEIGRDHDFDWAVIEPSSVQSIVQTSGRVNRHRLLNISKPNIAIMQYNIREVDGKNLVFHWPGFEVSGDYKYESHDLNELLNWDGLDKVDARLRFGDHLFTKLDDKSIDDVTEKIFAKMTSRDKGKNLWMALDTYTKSRLRDNDGMVRIELTLNKPYDDEKSFQFKEQFSKEEPVPRTVRSDGNKVNGWLSKTDAELVELAKEMLEDEEIDRALTVTVTANNASDVSRHRSFGFYRNKTDR